jgi:hypothetical protein
VYIATDRNTDERVAVKKISKTITDSVAFQREMDTLLHLCRRAPKYLWTPRKCRRRRLRLPRLRSCLGERNCLITSGPRADTRRRTRQRLVREAASAPFAMESTLFPGTSRWKILCSPRRSHRRPVIRSSIFGCGQVTFGDTWRMFWMKQPRIIQGRQEHQRTVHPKYLNLCTRNMQRIRGGTSDSPCLTIVEMRPSAVEQL